MTRLSLTALVAALLGACTASHTGDQCSTDRECTAPLLCDLDRGAGSVRSCVARCDYAIDGRLCDTGAVCATPYCAAGGVVAEGGISRVAPGVGDDCAFGLMGAYDYAVEPIVRRCRRACEWDSDDCRADEVCDAVQTCRQRCAAWDGRPFGVPCDPPAVCTWGGTMCVSPRRLARADCDGDGDLEQGTGDCFPEFRCDATAIGGCTFVPEGEL